MYSKPTIAAKLHISVIACLFVSMIMPRLSLAQGITFGVQPEVERPPAVIRELNWMNYNFLDKQRAIAENIARQKLGKQFHKTRSDLGIIQKLIDTNALEDADKQTLQAFGAIMGDVLETQHRKLHWRVYEDHYGSSHAICLDDTQECLFPMTLLSRRMEAGLKPDVKKIFNDVLDSIRPYYPFVPYSRENPPEESAIGGS